MAINKRFNTYFKFDRRNYRNTHYVDCDNYGNVYLCSHTILYSFHIFLILDSTSTLIPI